MNIVKKDTAKAEQYREQYYNNNKGYKLSDVYKSYSKAKEEAYERCLQFYNSVDGYSLRIVSSNLNTFTIGFRVKNGIYIITKNNKYFIEDIQE